MTIATAYGVRVLRETKDGEEVECWLAPAAHSGVALALNNACLFVGEDVAMAAAKSRGAKVARVVTVVALEGE